MFSSLAVAPPDAILGLADAFKHDPNPKKINLSVGVYKDEQGNTPILACVKEAARLLSQSNRHRSHSPAMEANCGRGVRARSAAARRFCLSRIRSGTGRRRRGLARADSAEAGIARLQLLLQEFWSLRRAGRCVDP